MIDIEKVLAYKTQQGYADCSETIEEHDKKIRVKVVEEFIRTCDEHAHYDMKKHPQNAYCIDRLTLLKIAEQLKIH